MASIVFNRSRLFGTGAATGFWARVATAAGAGGAATGIGAGIGANVCAGAGIGATIRVGIEAWGPASWARGAVIGNAGAREARDARGAPSPR